jgi:hypothetical protein
MEKVNVTATDKICIGKVIYKDKEYPLYLNKLNKFNYIRCKFLKDDSYIEVKLNWFNIPEEFRYCMMWHELGHIILDTDNGYLTDKFACQRVGFNSFKKCIDAIFISNNNLLNNVNDKNIFLSLYCYRLDAMSEIQKSIDDYFNISLSYNKETIEELWDKNFK